MCAERMQLFILAIVLGLVMGLAGGGQVQIAFIVQLALMILLLIGGFSGSCILLRILKKIIPPCEKSER